MTHILSQLGGLLLGSVPTVVMFILLVTIYGFVVRRPLDRILAERRARTTGAVEQARGAISAAEAETAVYEDKLRAAKNEIFLARDQKMKNWNAEREAALNEARALTQDRVRTARNEIEQGTVTARQQIEGLSAELSAQILRAVLPAGAVPSEAAQ